ncbi:MAG TPA: TonB-dependent receptor plug domain-containing protein [Terriglobales bacterium]|nr:TonB-dependent receptor plug domain-containing protein [Terriglobales bacterium]
MNRPLVLRPALLACLTGGIYAASVSTVLAEASGTEGTPDLQTITIIATGVSNMTAASQGDVSQQDLASQPVLRPGAVLENVPGLIVTQHSGEGKANQYFLRAFNLDHGTDLATEVDDMPVNMPTHAHGQGYTDLNFLIPELVSDLHYKKGPYYADEGDFATAGAVRMGLVNALPDSATLGFGQDGYRRALLMGSTALAGGTLLGAGDLYHNDGPFENPDDYNRVNGVVRYYRGEAQDFFTITAMAYSGRWNSTDQVPERAITDGLVGRFGTLSPSDGGISSRYSLSFNRVKRSENDQVEFSAYVIRYKLDLYSDFTYYLRDPIYADQMLQHDDRVVYGFEASKTWFGTLWDRPSSTVVGAQARVDDIRDVAIDATFERQYLSTRQDAGVVESKGAVYVENSTAWTGAVRTVLGLREDEFDLDVRDKMRNPDGSCNLTSDPLGCNEGTVRANIFSPKFGLILGPWAETSYYITLANGYHSNDARGVTRSGQNPDVPPVTPLTRATSAELGIATNPLPPWHTTLDVFLLKLQSELVFDGDAGVTAPSGATTRTGVEWGNTLRFNSWLHGDLNAAFSRGRFDHDVPPDDLGCGDAAPSHPCATPIAITGRYIPNSPTNVIDAGLTAQHPPGWFGSIRARHFGESPLVEDNSARSPAYTTLDLEVGYHSRGRCLFALDVFNLANAKWNDIEYYYVSRLANEAYATPDYVVHPGVPRTIRARFEYAL